MTYNKISVSVLIAISAACVGFTAVVTDNNLEETVIPDLANTSNDYVITPISVKGGVPYLLHTYIESTVTGYDIADYNIEAVSKVAAPTSYADLIVSYRDRTYGNTYEKEQRNFRFTTEPETIEIFFGLAFGRFDGHKAANYRWLASDIRLYTHKFADAHLMHQSHGNLVPNASFEDPTANFWYGQHKSGTIIETNAIHGTHVLEIASPVDVYIGIPVIPGETYDFSFWSASPDIGNGHQIEYGFSPLATGWDKAEGNTEVRLYSGGGDRTWKEYSGTFIPEEGQTTWYVGGMSNGGHMLFDSVYVARRAHPGTVIVVR